jgi:hypothetical protein
MLDDAAVCMEQRLSFEVDAAVSALGAWLQNRTAARRESPS